MTMMAWFAIQVAWCVCAEARTTVQVGMDAATGWTNNPGASEQPSESGAAYLSLRPTLRLTTGKPTATQDIDLAVIANMYFPGNDLNAVIARLVLRGRYELTSKARVFVMGGVGYQRANLFDVVSETALVDPTLLPASRFHSMDADVAANFVWDITPFWRLVDFLQFRTFVPFPTWYQSTLYTVGDSLTIDRLWNRAALGLILRAEYRYTAERLREVASPWGAVTWDRVPVRDSFIGELSLRGRYDLSRQFTGMISGGAVLWMDALGFGDDGTSKVAPTATASLRYFASDLAAAALIYKHDTEFGEFIPGTFQVDRVTLAGGALLHAKSLLFLTASAGYAYSRMMNTEGTAEYIMSAWLAGAMISMSPLRWLCLYANYRFMEQDGISAMTGPAPNLTRHMVMIGLRGNYGGGFLMEPLGVNAFGLGDRVDGADGR